MLDGIDNNCDGFIDETFNGTDADADGLLDLEEYLEIGTDPFNEDTDGDGLTDGIEILSTFTNPLVPDLDEDQDGFRWFLDCDDNDSSRSPNAVEVWNGLDDDCDDLVDEDVNRASWITPTPLLADVNLNATNDSLELGILLDLDSESIQRLNITVQWYRNQTLLAQGFTFSEQPHNCQQPSSEFSIELCALNGSIGPYEVKAVVFDAAGFIEVKWSVTYTVWQPPVVEDEEEETIIQTNENEESSALPENLLIWVLAGVVGVLSLVLVFTRRQNESPKPQARPNQAPAAFVGTQKYSNVPVAPEFSQLGEYVPPSNNDWDTNRWK